MENLSANTHYSNHILYISCMYDMYNTTQKNNNKKNMFSLAYIIDFLSLYI